MPPNPLKSMTPETATPHPVFSGSPPLGPLYPPGPDDVDEDLSALSVYPALAGILSL